MARSPFPAASRRAASAWGGSHPPSAHRRSKGEFGKVAELMAPLLPGIAMTRAKGYKALGLRLGLRLGLKVRLGWGWGCGQGEMGRGHSYYAGGGGAVAQHAYCDYTYCGYTYSHRVVPW